MKWWIAFVIVIASFLLINLIEVADSFTLFKEEDHSAPIVDDRFGNFYEFGACVNLVDGYKSVKSVDTSRDCVQLYEKENCKGVYIKIPSGIFKYNNLKELKFDDRAVSVGRCWSIVKLYNQGHYQGRRLRIRLQDQDDCVTLHGTERVVNSVEIDKGCLVLYKDDSCENTLTRVMDRKSDTSGMGLVGSIGPCSDRNKYDTNFYTTQLNPSSVNPGVLMLGEFVRSENAAVIKTPEVPHDHYCELARRCSKNRLLDCQQMRSASTCYCELNKKIVLCDIWQPPNWVRVSSNYEAVENYRHTRTTLLGEVNGEGISIGSWSYDTPYVNIKELKRRCEIDANSAAVPGRMPGGVQESCSGPQCYPHELPKFPGFCGGGGSFIVPRNVSVIEEDEDFEAFSYN